MAEQQTDVTNTKKIPKTPQSLITESHVKATLAADKGSDAQLISWSTENFTKKGDNYACIVMGIRVNYRQGGSEKKISYVAKCNPCRGVLSLEHFTRVIFEKEAGFYQKLLPRLNAELNRTGQDNLRLSSCYFTYPGKNEEVIILHDLRNEDFKMCDRFKGMDTAHALLVLKELGRLHAASILFQETTSEDLSATYKFLEKDLTYYLSEINTSNNIFESYIINAEKMLEKIGGYESTLKWLRDFIPKVVDTFEEQLKYSAPFDVICHGDCWNNNVLFRYDESGFPVDVRLLDLQMSRRSSPATDLNYFMYTSLNGAERRENLQMFLKAYHDSFSRTLQEAGTSVPFTLEELRQEFHRKNLFGLIMGVMIVPIIVSEAADVMDLDNIVEDDVDKFIEEFRENVLKQLDHNPILRPRLLSIFDDMLEYGIIT